MTERFKGLTNNGASRGDEGRLLRRIYTDHGITPPADLGTKKEPLLKRRKSGKKGNSKKHRIKIWPNGIREIY